MSLNKSRLRRRHQRLRHPGGSAWDRLTASPIDDAACCAAGATQARRQRNRGAVAAGQDQAEQRYAETGAPSS